MGLKWFWSKKELGMKNRLPVFLSISLILLATLACSLTANTPSISPEDAVTITNTSTPSLLPTPTQSAAPTSTEASNPSPTQAVVETPQLTSIRFFDETHGWGVTSQYVLRTEDGGATWTNVTPAGITDFGYSPTSYFLDVSHGWVVLPDPSDPTLPGQLFRTTDGGASWQESSFPAGSGGSFSFVDANTGFYLAALGAGAGSEWVAVESTTDGGATWETVFTHEPGAAENPGDLPAGGMKSGITFRDATHGWVTGNEPADNFFYLYYSTDGGSKWVQQPAEIPSALGTVFVGTYPPVFFGQNGIMPVTLVGNVINLVIYTSKDGGASWTSAPGLVANAGRGELTDFVTPNDGFVWATGRFAVTHDGAQSWDTVTPSVAFGDNFSSMDFVNTSTGWVVTMDANSHTSLYKTTDGGTNWTPLIP
jgi:photosystem II stability/assembly factor-like uncharacterized protein